MPHQYIDRRTSKVRTEKLFADSFVNLVFSREREDAGVLFNVLSSARFSRIMAFLNYDLACMSKLAGAESFLKGLGIDLKECLDDPRSLDTPRKVFERKISYWDRRPMPPGTEAIVSPADAKALVGSFSRESGVFIKDKFFLYRELLGFDRPAWQDAFSDGDFALFRLTPDKYHYNHVPVSGRVADIYEIPGRYLSCNPGVAVVLATPYSKNKRVVTVIDTDVEGGTGAGLVAMIEVAALMIGDIVQCYSRTRYDTPVDVRVGMFLEKGQPKSLYRPGSSTDVLIFQKGRVRFSGDLVANMRRGDAVSRYSFGFGRPLVETDLEVRSQIASAVFAHDKNKA